MYLDRYISAPFGNWFSSPNYTSVLGTFTLEPRKGLLWRLLKTLRYSFNHNGWTNRLGLRNPGITIGMERYYHSRVLPHKSIVSIYGYNQEEWEKLSTYTKNVPTEINLSCPNTSKQEYNTSCPIEMFDMDNTIVKMSPLTKEQEIDELMRRGVKKWHFSNTLPVAQGGLSGKTLMQYNMRLIKHTLWMDEEAYIIGGGGITNESDVAWYRDLGCSGVSLGSVFFQPFAMRKFELG